MSSGFFFWPYAICRQHIFQRLSLCWKACDSFLKDGIVCSPRLHYVTPWQQRYANVVICFGQNGLHGKGMKPQNSSTLQGSDLFLLQLHVRTWTLLWLGCRLYIVPEEARIVVLHKCTKVDRGYIHFIPAQKKCYIFCMMVNRNPFCKWAISCTSWQIGSLENIFQHRFVTVDQTNCGWRNCFVHRCMKRLYRIWHKQPSGMAHTTFSKTIWAIRTVFLL